MAGASTTQIEDMKAKQDAVHRERTIRENRRVVSISKRNQQIQARNALSTSYCFHAIEPLKTFTDKEMAQEILEKLANDRGILAVMAKHKWSVGVLAEMLPDGKVGVDPVCVLGLNQNKGQRILLRLRTDDLLGFRKFLSIKKVLFHELSHNVHSEHDTNFYQLMRQIEKESNELDWTKAGGAAVGRSRMILHDEEKSMENSSSGHRLGGESAGSSRLEYKDGLLFGVPHALLVITIGKTGGSTLAFLMGRYMGKEMIGDYLRTNFPTFRAFSAALNSSSWKPVVLYQLSSIPNLVKIYSLAITQVSVTRFIVSSAIGNTPHAILCAYIGDQASDIAAILTGETKMTTSRMIMVVTAVSMTVLAITFLVVYMKRQLQELQKRECRSGSEEELLLSIEADAVDPVDVKSPSQRVRLSTPTCQM
ncbi:unnamed protein product [Peronospora belbahrii]|uniref:WLM domain-containing protein n=1 Tax=Peronospora belbahrii TaxID=622444 RepID=A0AAU9KLE5_9STRA|nr:unnamed protein product [Peronospora belbahrii]